MGKKPVSTYERMMQDQEFREEHQKEYKDFVRAELLLAMKTGDKRAVQKLAQLVE